MNKNAYKLLHEGTLAFADMEYNGIKVDVRYCRRQKKNINQQIELLELELDRTEEMKVWRKRYKDDFNLDSTDQLKKVLFTDLKITPPAYTDKGNPSVNKDNLNLIDSPIVEPLIKLRQLKKLNNTYLKNIMEETVNGYIHPSFNLHTVQTFRSSCDRPNFQNMPIRDPFMGKIIRTAFIPRENSIIGGLDYAGIELSMAGCNSKDPLLIKDYITIHKTQAARCFALKEKQVTKDIRYYGKNGFVFPQLYGSWNVPIAENLLRITKGMQTVDNLDLYEHLEAKGISHPEIFQDHIENVETRFWETYSVHKKWQEGWISNYYKKGYIEMLTGFRCKGILSKNQLFNYANQGIAFHCLLWSIIQMNKWLKKYKMKSKLIWNIHDDMGLDIHNTEKEDVLQKAKEIMCIEIKKAWKWIITPLEIEAEFSNKNWYEKEKVKI
jgi:DNA polymerase-1